MTEGGDQGKIMRGFDNPGSIIDLETLSLII
jgi:hypothetical protein